MEKPQLQYEIINKLSQVLLQLRVDIKQQQVLRFQNLLRNPPQSEQRTVTTLSKYLSSLVKKDSNDIKPRLQALQKQYQSSLTNLSQADLDLELAPITANFEFFFQNKQNPKIIHFIEKWEFDFKRNDAMGNMNLYDKELSSVRYVEQLFHEIIGFAKRLPLWANYWGDVVNRKQVKQGYTFQHKVQLKLTEAKTVASVAPDPFGRYDNSFTLQHLMPGLKARCRINFDAAPPMLVKKTPQNSSKNLGQALKSEHRSHQKPSTLLSREDSQESVNRQKKSVYSFYDEQLEITFVSSNHEIGSIRTKQGNNKLVETRLDAEPEKQDSDEFEMVLDEEEDSSYNLFIKEIQSVRPQFLTIIK